MKKLDPDLDYKNASIKREKMEGVIVFLPTIAMVTDTGHPNYQTVKFGVVWGNRSIYIQLTFTKSK